MLSSGRSSSYRPRSALQGCFLLFTISFGFILYLLWVLLYELVGPGIGGWPWSVGSVTVHSGHLIGSELEVFAAN